MALKKRQYSLQVNFETTKLELPMIIINELLLLIPLFHYLDYFDFKTANNKTDILGPD